MFDNEAEFLLCTLPGSIVLRIEHFGSTAIPGLSAKPIIDILVEVSSLEETKEQIVPLLESEGYEYFWRPPFNETSKPEEYYAWFIKRNTRGKRTHHIHMVEADSKLWDRLYFRDYLKEFPEKTGRYQELKHSLSKKYPNNRIAYTEGKADFIVPLTEKARQYYDSKE